MEEAGEADTGQGQPMSPGDTGLGAQRPRPQLRLSLAR